MEKIKCEADRMFEQTGIYPTRFELLTALAFLYYYEKQCDFVVLEAGLGGRLDSTNIIETPLVAVIMQIEMCIRDREMTVASDYIAVKAEEDGVCIIGLTRGKAVSYTHLDVYKRQRNARASFYP